jgi:hypothetical protein
MRLIGKAAALAAMMAALGAAHADVLYSAPGTGSEMATPGSSSISFDAGASSSGMLTFTLDGYLSLDGWANGWTDVFHLSSNGTEILTGSFNLGGGGTSSLALNSNGASYVFNGAPDNQITWQGGTVDFSVPLELLAGTNTVEFSYTGTAQGLADEGWALSNVEVTGVMTPVPEPTTAGMLMVGLLAAGGLRSASRKKKSAR